MTNNELELPSGVPEGFLCTASEGLSSEEAARKAKAGESNTTVSESGKSTGRILADNLFTFFNFLNLALAFCLLLAGSYRNMLFVLIVLSNTIVGTVQEIRARNTIRRLKLLNAPSVHVIRNGSEISISPGEIVRGDRMVLRAGDQVTADALVLEGNGSAMESLLTGESNPIPKFQNSWLYSGSYITEGKLFAQAVYVADESYAGRLTREAKKESRPKSALMTELDSLIRKDTLILIPLGLLLFAKQIFLNHVPFNEAVPSSVAAMIGMIPEGLILLTSVAMAVGVVKLGMKKALVQELSGIETLARVDVLCLDKTGTITTGKMTVETVFPVDTDQSTLCKAMSRFLGAFDEASGTLDALRQFVQPGNEKPLALLPFSSSRKKSAVSFEDGKTLILGAAEFVLGDFFPETLSHQISLWTEKGRRVTVLAEAEGVIQNDELPPVHKILGVFVLQDEIRPNAADTLHYFQAQGVSLKIISGDDPRTVSHIASEVGLQNAEQWVDATTLTDIASIEDACEHYTIFGRVTPVQKKQLVLALRKQGHSVGMTGDGVNDIPALKAANCSIAMAGGADAARHAAQVTLLDSDFARMPDLVLEGRRVINNITRASSLFLTKTLFSFGLSLLSLLLPFSYPFQPIHMTLVSSLTVGIPSFFLALEPSHDRIRGHFLRTVLSRAIPGGLAVTLCSAVCMLLTGHFGLTGEQCSTIATLVAGTVGLFVLLRSCLPLDPVRGIIVAAMTLIFVLTVRFLGSLFLLVPLSTSGWIIFLALAFLSTGIILLTEAMIRKKA